MRKKIFHLIDRIMWFLRGKLLNAFFMTLNGNLFKIFFICKKISSSHFSSLYCYHYTERVMYKFYLTGISFSFLLKLQYLYDVYLGLSIYTSFFAITIRSDYFQIETFRRRYHLHLENNIYTSYIPFHQFYSKILYSLRITC